MCVEQMREHGYNVGGEQSGHIVLSDYTTTGDGLVAALQVLAVVKKRDKPVSRGLPPLRAAAAGAQERPLQEAASRWRTPRCSSAIERRRDRASTDSGRLVIRPSGTEPVIRVMAEGDDQELVEAVVDGLVEVLTQTAA